MTQPILQIERLPHGEGLDLPVYQTAGSAAMDIRAAVSEPMVLCPMGAPQVVPAGFKMAIPPGFEGQIRPRSGLALKNGITIPNSPGTVDSDYRGEVGVILRNEGLVEFTITRGVRIAQLVIAPVAKVEIVECDALPASGRGEGGYGHTGVE